MLVLRSRSCLLQSHAPQIFIGIDTQTYVIFAFYLYETITEPSDRAAVDDTSVALITRCVVGDWVTSTRVLKVTGRLLLGSTRISRGVSNRPGLLSLLCFLGSLEGATRTDSSLLTVVRYRSFARASGLCSEPP